MLVCRRDELARGLGGEWDHSEDDLLRCPRKHCAREADIATDEKEFGLCHDQLEPLHVPQDDHRL